MVRRAVLAATQKREVALRLGGRTAYFRFFKDVFVGEDMLLHLVPCKCRKLGIGNILLQFFYSKIITDFSYNTNVVVVDINQQPKPEPLTGQAWCVASDGAWRCSGSSSPCEGESTAGWACSASASWRERVSRGTSSATAVYVYTGVECFG